MKKTLAIIIAVIMLAAVISIPVIADTQTTTLTTTVPEAQYMMTVPEALEIEFGATDELIGKVDVEAVSGFNVGKNVQVTVTHDDLTAEGKSTKIPYKLKASSYGEGNNSSTTFSDNGTDNVLLFKSSSEMKLYPVRTVGLNASETANFLLTAHFSATDWGKALAGEYTSTITFEAKIVAEEAAG